MPQGPAARITDPVVHPLPPVLTPGPGSLNTLIGFLPAWRAIPTAAAAGIQAAKQAADVAVQTAEAATKAAAGTPGAPAALAAEQTLKASTLAAMTSTIASASMGADIHACVTPSPVPPHGPGVVIDGSPTVLINNLPASRMGDTIIEPLGPPNKIAMGCPTVIIGQSGSGCSISGGGGSAAGGVATVGGSGGSAIPASSDAAGKSTLSGPTPPVSGSGSASSTPASGGGGSPGGGSPAAKALTSAAASATGVITCTQGCEQLAKAAGPADPPVPPVTEAPFVPVPGATPAERAESLPDEEKRTCAESLVNAAQNSSATISLDEGCDCLSNAAGS